MGKPNDVDIWGNSTEGKRECFRCGTYYPLTVSTAPVDYQGTYCSIECFEKDTLELKMSSEAEARFNAHTEVPPTTELKIGDFVLKIRKEGN